MALSASLEPGPRRLLQGLVEDFSMARKSLTSSATREFAEPPWVGGLDTGKSEDLEMGPKTTRGCPSDSARRQGHRLPGSSVMEACS